MGKLTQTSDNSVEIDSLQELFIIVKKINKNVGGRSFIIPKEYDKILYNPKSQFSCFIDCLKQTKVTF